MDTFSENLLARLQELKMKPYRLAKLSGLNIQHCYKIVSGERRPSDRTLEKIASVAELELSFDQLRRWRDLCNVMDLAIYLQDLPDDLLIKEIYRRFPEPEVREEKLMGEAPRVEATP